MFIRVIMPRFDEKHLVEDYIIEKLKNIGWQYVPPDELERESYEEPLLVSTLVRCIQRINKDLNLSDEEISKVLNELNLVTSGQEGAKRILNYYKFGVPVKFEKERIIKYVQLFDYEDIESNECIVTRQVYYSGRDKIRTDILLYVNGIPLVNIECKDPTKPGVSWYDAFEQIKEYEKSVPELYKYVQIGVASESKAKYFAIVPWQDKDSIKYHEWRESTKNSIDATITMLHPHVLLDIMKNFLFSRLEMGNATKVITRYMQYRAANKIVKRVLTNLEHAGKEIATPFDKLRARNDREREAIRDKGREEGIHDDRRDDQARNHGGEAGHIISETDKDKGLIWHWQGSGKTLTMIFAAHKLYYDLRLANPTIFFVVDRIELEEQLYTEFYALDIMQPDIIQTVADLQEVLEYDNKRGKRGIFITLIHKFRSDELKKIQEGLEDSSRNRNTIMTRKNVIAFVDEGHRSQYGTLAAQMKAILKNAFVFALTGTPISKPRHGRDTYLEFAYPPEERYLDRYFIVDSIKDGFTVKIVYQPRLEKDVHLKKEMLESFLEVELDEIPEYARSEVEAKLKRKLNPINVFLENQERIARVAEDIAGHFRENIDGKFKALIVAASRKACVYYKNALEKHLPRDYFDVVMTSERDSEDIIYGYVRETRAKYDGKDYKSSLKKIIEKFKEDDHPKILIVTDMLLTGFDVPQLQVMYLDKPLKEHRLLQAIARTNRPYKDLKQAGIIIDYVGILKEFKRAFELYSKEDSLDTALNDFENIRNEFDLLISEIRQLFTDLTQDYERDTLLKAVELLTTDVSKEEEFIQKYRHLRKLFELLGSDPYKLKHFDMYKWISAIYTYYMKMVMRGTSIDAYVHKYYDKTLKYVYKATEIENLEHDLPEVTFDADSLKKLDEKVKSREEKAANILFMLQRFVLVDKQKNPVFESLADRVQRLVDLWREKTKDYDRIYKEGIAIFDDIQMLQSRQQSMGMSNLEYALLLALEEHLQDGNTFADKIRDLYTRLQKSLFPGWTMQTTISKTVEKEVRRFVRHLKTGHKLSMDDMDKLYIILMSKVKRYGTQA